MHDSNDYEVELLAPWPKDAVRAALIDLAVEAFLLEFRTLAAEGTSTPTSAERRSWPACDFFSPRVKLW